MDGFGDLVRIEQEADVGLPLLVALAGPIDAGFTVQRFAHQALTSGPVEPVASFDSDALFVYASRPSTARLERSLFTEVSVPAVTVNQVVDPGGRPFLLVSGPEPDMRWVGFTRTLLELTRRWDVSTVWCVNAVPWMVPHTRPVSVWVTSHDMELQARYATPAIDAQIGPAPTVALLQAAAVDFPRVHIATARVPQYLSRYPYVPAPAALIDTVNRECGLGLALPPVDDQLEAHLAAQSRTQPMFQMLLSALEESYDSEREMALSDDLAGDLVAQVEAYLAGLPGDAPGPLPE